VKAKHGHELDDIRYKKSSFWAKLDMTWRPLCCHDL